MAAPLTLLEASTTPTLLPEASFCAEASEVTAFDTVELRSSADVALTRIAPDAFTSLLSTSAVAFDGCSPFIASEISGSARIASTALNRRFDAFQPSALKLRSTPTPVAPVLVAEIARASSVAELSAVTATSPPCASSAESVTRATASASTMLVAIAPLTASDSPVPQAEPPEDVTSVFIRASMVAFSSAATVIEPPVEVTSILSITADAAAETSLVTMMPP